MDAYANAYTRREVAASELIATTMMRDRTTVVKATVGSVSTKASWNTRTKGIGLERSLGEIFASGEDVADMQDIGALTFPRM